MKIILDNGHGINTSGKCSPDGKLKEYAWNREIAKRIEQELKSKGYDAQRIVTEDTDISLSERCRRANAICKTHGTKNCVFISVHINAAGGDNKWHDARGWSGWVGRNSSSNSKKLAQILYAEAERKGLKGNRSVPACKYWEADFTVLTKTLCPAVLTENLFQDNSADVEYLLSEEGKKAIVDRHVNGLIQYINSLK